MNTNVESIIKPVYEVPKKIRVEEDTLRLIMISGCGIVAAGLGILLERLMNFPSFMWGFLAIFSIWFGLGLVYAACEFIASFLSMKR